MKSKTGLISRINEAIADIELATEYVQFRAMFRACRQQAEFNYTTGDRRKAAIFDEFAILISDRMHNTTSAT